MAPDYYIIAIDGHYHGITDLRVSRLTNQNRAFQRYVINEE